MVERAVAILFEPEGEWSLAAIKGIADYARRFGRWRLLCAPRDHQGRIELPPGWKGQGILTRMLSVQDYKRCLSYRIPVVDLDAIVPWKPHRRLARVMTNNEVRTKLVVQHLLSRNLRHFACFNPPHREYTQVRLMMIQKKLQEKGVRCEMFWNGSAQSWHRLHWEKQQESIRQWIERSPSGTGVVTPDGRQGRLLSEWCNFLNVRIPDDLAILTCDDDGLLSSISSPPLSGVVLASHQHGFAAAELLDQMMDGEPSPRQPLLIDPLHVITRQSTDFLTLANPEIVRAVRYIRENAVNGIQVADVVNHLSVSRRWLEQKFHHAVGHTIGDEIRQTRFNNAMSQLASTELSVEEIAAASGFSTGASFCRSFRASYGETPLDFRKRSRP